MPFLKHIERARRGRAVSVVVQDAERQGLADEGLREAAPSRTRRPGELAWRTREAVKLWVRFVPGNGGMYLRMTRPF